MDVFLTVVDEARLFTERGDAGEKCPIFETGVRF